MSLPIVFRKEARIEFDEAFDAYETQRAGRGVEFTLRVQDVLDRITVNPELHAVVAADVRRAVITRFPYCLYYRANATRIEVIAVFHASRDPSVWRNRA